MSSSSSTKPGANRPISVLLLLLASTTISSPPIMENEESTFDRNNMVMIQIDIPPLTRGTIIFSTGEYVNGSSSIHVGDTAMDIRGDVASNIYDDETTIYSAETKTNNESQKVGLVPFSTQ